MESHKVLQSEIITRADKPCAKKHELLGTQRIYEYLESHENGSVSVHMHCHGPTPSTFILKDPFANYFLGQAGSISSKLDQWTQELQSDCDKVFLLDGFKLSKPDCVPTAVEQRNH